MKKIKNKKTVNPKRVSNWHIPIWSNIFGVNVRFDCGICGFSQTIKTSLKNTNPVECKNCKALNNIEIHMPESDEE